MICGVGEIGRQSKHVRIVHLAPRRKGHQMKTKRQALEQALAWAWELHAMGERVKMDKIKGCYIVVACGPRED